MFRRFRSRLVGLLVGLLICHLPIISFADGPNVLMFLWDGETNAEKGFKDSLTEEYSAGNINYTILDAYKDINRLKELIDSTDDTSYNLIYTYGSAITFRVAKNFQNTPIVFNIVFDPVKYNIIDTWNDKQQNLTGISNSIPVAIQIEKIQEIFGIGDIGFIYAAKDQESEELKGEMESCLSEKKQKIFSFEYKNNDYKGLRKFRDRIKDRVKCIYIASSRDMTKYIRRVLMELNRNKIPTCVTNKSYLKEGALLCISAEYYRLGKKAGKYAAGILNGAKLADLPVLQASESDIELFVNSSILKKLNLKLPKELDINYI